MIELYAVDYVNTYIDKVVRIIHDTHYNLFKEREQFKKTADLEKAKIISKILEMDLANFNIDEKGISKHLKINFSKYKNEELFKEIENFINLTMATEIYFIKRRVNAQLGTKGFANVQEIEDFINECFKDTETMKFIERLKNMQIN